MCKKTKTKQNMNKASQRAGTRSHKEQPTPEPPITKTRLFKFHLQKLKIFGLKNSDIFHISAQNIDCRYSLEPPRWGGSNEYPRSMFLSRNKKTTKTNKQTNKQKNKQTNKKNPKKTNKPPPPKKNKTKKNNLFYCKRWNPCIFVMNKNDIFTCERIWYFH